MAADSAQRFEGSYLGDSSRVDATARLECKVCWYVYDPAQGDEHWQIPAGTAFSDLPPHWTCPNCACEKEQFMVLAD
jgi:rubredoxin